MQNDIVYENSIMEINKTRNSWKAGSSSDGH